MNDATPSPVTPFLVLLACFLGGPLAAVSLSTHLAPGAEVAPALAGLLASAVLFGGLIAWLGLAVLSLLTPGGRRRVRAEQPPAGTSAFIWLAVPAGAVAGFLTALSAETFFTPLWLTTAVFTVYGYLLHRLARAGLLPFVEDVG